MYDILKTSQAGRSPGYCSNFFCFLGSFQYRRLIRRLLYFERNVNAISARVRHPRIVHYCSFLEPISFSVPSCTQLGKNLASIAQCLVRRFYALSSTVGNQNAMLVQAEANIIYLGLN